MNIIKLLTSLVLVFCINSGLIYAYAECTNCTQCPGNSYVESDSEIRTQSELTPLDILILDLEDVQQLIIDGDNHTAITILKSAGKNVRKVKEFDAGTKKITSKRIKKGIKLLKQNKNDEALELLQTAFDALEEEGLI